MPSSIRDGLLGIVDAAAGTETGQLTGRASDAVTFGSIGTGAALAQPGSLAAGAARSGMRAPELPMDRASIDARSKAGGFLTKKGSGDFLTVYHGTNREISPGFLRNPPDRATNAPTAEVATWTTEGPSVAQVYAEHAALSGGAPSILPLRVRADKVGTIDLARTGSNLTEKEVASSLLHAWDNGYDAVRIINFTGPDGKISPYVNWAIKDPAQLRSPHAAFDPAKRDSNDLLAGLAAPLPLGPPIGLRGPTAVPGMNPAPTEEDRRRLRNALSDREY